MTRSEADGALAARAGSRLRCTSCGTEIVVVRPPAAALICCGVAMVDRRQPVEGSGR